MYAVTTHWMSLTLVDPSSRPMVSRPTLTIVRSMIETNAPRITAVATRQTCASSPPGRRRPPPARADVGCPVSAIVVKYLKVRNLANRYGAARAAPTTPASDPSSAAITGTERVSSA